jgi:hypothetical protein
MVEAIDRLSTLFFHLELGFLLLTTGMGFNYVGEVRNRGGGNEGAPAMVVKPVWWLGFGFKVKLS